VPVHMCVCLWMRGCVLVLGSICARRTVMSMCSSFCVFLPQDRWVVLRPVLSHVSVPPSHPSWPAGSGNAMCLLHSPQIYRILGKTVVCYPIVFDLSDFYLSQDVMLLIDDIKVSWGELTSYTRLFRHSSVLILVLGPAHSACCVPNCLSVWSMQV
jgi:hypothetical protein